MGSAEDWQMVTEKVYRPKGSPGRLGAYLMYLTAQSFLISIPFLITAGRLDESFFTFDFYMSVIATILFFGVFGWGALFMKLAYYKTIDQLTFKTPEGKEEFRRREMVYSDKHAALGVILTYLTFGVVLSTWPLYTAFFPLTPQLMIPFLLVLISVGFMGLVGIDAVAAIPSLLLVPGKLEEHLQISLLKPDRCGGAKAIGDFYFVMTVLVAVIGSLVVVMTGYFRVATIGYVLSIAIMALALMVFFVPQMSIRDLLRREKLSRLEEISERVEDFSEPTEDVDREDLIVAFMQVQSLIMLYGEIEKLREFPFETGTLQKVVSTALIPIIIEIFVTLLPIT